MRLSTVFISSAFVLAGMSAALPTEREHMLVARFSDSDFFTGVEARAYVEEPELYARGNIVPKASNRHNRPGRPSSPQSASREFLPNTNPPSRSSIDASSRPPSPFTAAEERPGSDFSGPRSPRYPNRRSFYETPRDELTRRGVRDWVKNNYSKAAGFFGGSRTPAQQTDERR